MIVEKQKGPGDEPSPDYYQTSGVQVLHKILISSAKAKGTR